MNQHHEPHVNERKKQEVERLKKLFQEYPVVAIADLEHLPAANLQKIKKSLRGKAAFMITKRRRVIIAINESKQNLPNADALLDRMKGMVALLFSNEDPFQLYKIVQKNIAPAPARAGQESPEDITIPAGPTQFMAGPMIGELGQLGLKTEVKEGKIAIKEDKVIVKQGQIITAKVAELLTKFGIEPMKVGLNVVCTYQKGEILGKEILGVSEEEYIGFIQTSHQEAMNLAVFIAYPCKETIDLLIQKAAREGKGLADTIKFDELQQQPSAEKKEAAPESVTQQLQEKSPEPTPQKEIQEPSPLPQPRSEPVHTQSTPIQKPREEVPVKQEEKRDHPVHQHQEKPHHEEKPQAHQEKPQPREQPQEPKKTDEQVAQEVLKRLQDEKMKQQMRAPPKNGEASIQQQEKDLTKIINKLKDQKSKGK